MIRSILFLFVLALSSWSAFAEEIEVPEEELARETTLPVFDKRRIVLNRSVVTKEKFEFGAGAGLQMNEPYYSSLMFNAQGTYNFTETSALNVMGLSWNNGLSSYGSQLQAGSGTKGQTGYVQPFDASKVPHPLWGIFGNYQFTAYYGKISVSKLGVMNLNLFGLLGLGYINMNSVNTFGLNVGAGQNFYFTKNFALRFDLRYLIFQGPNATSQKQNDTPPVGPNNYPAATGSNQIFYNAQVGLTAIFIL